MQVILTKDVPKVGRQFDVKTVADGYALNFLFPRGLAEMATDEKVATLEAKRAEIAHLIETEEKALAEAIRKLDGAKVTIEAGKVSDEGTLYKGVNADMVAEALSKAAGVKITADTFLFDQPIKTVGEHPLTLRVEDVSATCTLVVEGEE